MSDDTVARREAEILRLDRVLEQQRIDHDEVVRERDEARELVAELEAEIERLGLIEDAALNLAQFPGSTSALAALRTALMDGALPSVVEALRAAFGDQPRH